MELESVFMSIEVPVGMSKEGALARARVLIPCKTGVWEEIQVEDGWMVGNLECEIGYYEENPRGAEYGPDDAGVTVTWETP